MLAVLLLGYASSRALAASYIFDMNYVTEDQNSKSKPIAVKQSLADLLLVLVIGLSPLALFNLSTVITLVVCLLLFRYVFKKWLHSRLTGYTGDCLGAAQQLSELLIYSVLLAMVHHTSLHIGLTGMPQ